ncbi:putative MFS transporter [Talaromyces proteolyticus]|uniref:MFS transporter n=1 Tax=Talaromyces proteolyticus TaxID=1131652 RepID=A0AAD4PTK2_9EURO|nr:putative MFS transporter [Talaromyces proteolyticus]KAH8693593.1 putative MFS transporter [Talaromyces proteolyticus]
MGLGVLEDTKLDHVPGTSFVMDDQNSAREGTSHEIKPWLKYDRSGPVPIVLVPQPSDDPYDPLNWPLWKRDVILAILSLVAVLCATMSPIMAANTVDIALYYSKNFTDVALLTGYHLLGVGVAGIFCVPTARVWGKRHLFIIGNVLMIISCAWAGGSSNSYRSLTAARVFQGFALAPFEALVNTCVGDLYFVHERGKRMALSNVALFGGAFLTPVFVGKITASLSWEWTFYFVAIFTAAALPFMIFFVPETAYRRADYLNTDFLGDAIPPSDYTGPQASSDQSDTQMTFGREKVEPHGSSEGLRDGTQAAQIGGEQLPTRDGNVTMVPREYSYRQTLKLFNGRKTDEDFLKLLLRPFPLFLHPGILWACLTQGVLIGWTVFIGVVLAVVYMTPPLWFDEVQTGYMYTSAFIGSIIGLVLSGLLSDWINKIMIKRNKGTYEPEFRIVLVFFQLIFSGIGLFGFGITANDIKKYGWLIPDVFFSFVIIGMVMGAVSSALYIVDAHRQIAVEAFTCMLIFKNFFSFVLTFFAYNWLVVKDGSRIPFEVIGAIQIFICLLAIPMYIFGKKNRSFFARNDILKILHLW